MTKMEKEENTKETKKIEKLEKTEESAESGNTKRAETERPKPVVGKLLGKGCILAAVVLLLMSCLPEDPDDHDSSSVYAAKKAESLTENTEDIEDIEEQNTESEQETGSGQEKKTKQKTAAEKKESTEQKAVAEPGSESEKESISGQSRKAVQDSGTGRDADTDQKAGLNEAQGSEQMTGHEEESEKMAGAKQNAGSGRKTESERKTASVQGAGSETGQETETEETETEEAALSAASKKALILKNKDQYPEDILKLLEINSMEAIDFVLDYPEKKGKVYAEDITDDYEEGKIPLLIQWDERWGYGSYGNNVVAVSGCGPTCMAMVVAGLTGNTDVTPYTMAKYSDENGYVTQEGNTMWTFIREGGMDYGVVGTDIALDEEIVKEVLQAGKPVICSMRPGDFTTSGHFIVLTGYEDGMISVNDPASKIRSGQLWTFERLAPQIKNLWMCEYVGDGENSDDGTATGDDGYSDYDDYSYYEEYDEYEEYAGDDEYSDY